MKRRTARLGALLAVLGALGFACEATAQARIHAQLPKPSSPVDRSSPRSTMALFLRAARDGDYARAAYALDLRAVPAADRAERGPVLARKLHTVITRTLWIDLDELPEPEGSEREVIVDRFALGAERVPLRLKRVSLGGGSGWLISYATVSRVDDLYARYGPTWVEQRLPPPFHEVRFLDLALWQWLGLPLGLLLALLMSVALTALLLRVGWRIASRTKATWDDLLMGTIRGPSRAFLTVAFFWGIAATLQLPLTAERIIGKALQVALTASVAWLLFRLVNLVASAIEQQAVQTAESEGDDLKARGVRTQARVMQRVATIAVAFIAISIILLQFEPVRTVGMSLLASAGVVGIIFGLAAQRTIGTMLAGIQVSITQPIRIGDTVIFAGQWGAIEEITLTYVVVRLWDDRRLVAPITKFLDESFENWTKVSPQLFGVVFLYVDYRLSVDAVREQVERIVRDHPSWDERLWSVLVTDARERTMEVRVMVSAKNAAELWKLRCEMRERLIAWLQEHQDGRYLPRARVELDGQEPPALPRAAE